MKKRLRKKSHVKEFAEYGIEFEIKVISPIKEEAFNKLVEDFVTVFVEGQDLYCGGGWKWQKRTGGFLVEIGSTIESAERYLPKIKKWFEDMEITFEFSSYILDLWYPEREIV